MRFPLQATHKDEGEAGRNSNFDGQLLVDAGSALHIAAQ